MVGNPAMESDELNNDSDGTKKTWSVQPVTVKLHFQY